MIHSLHLLLALLPFQQPAPTDGNARKTELLARISEAVRKSTAVYLGEGQVEQSRRQVEQVKGGGNPGQLFQARFGLAEALMAVGELDEALTEYTACVALAEEIGDRKLRTGVLKKLVICHLRMAEATNCVGHHNCESCIFPLSQAAVHPDKKSCVAAINRLEQILRPDPNDLWAIWLLNLAHMQKGDWPDAVADVWRLPPSDFASERDFPRFENAAPELGLDCFQRSGGGTMDDFDGDGRLDIVTSCIDPFTPLRLLMQQPDGRFKDMAAERGLAGQTGGLWFLQADFDNDGRLDLFVTRGAWLRNFGEMPGSLLMQQADGSFLDRTLEAGVEIAAPSQVAAAADVDKDGDLDLFLGFESERTPAGLKYPSRLFLNRGDATFEDVTARAGVTNDRYCKGAAFGDYDGDGFPDLYVSNLGGWNRLYRNQGDGTFRDVATELGVHTPFESFACWWFDENNDGWLDLYVTCYNIANRAAEVAASYMNGTTGLDTHRIFENDGHGHFRDVTRERNMQRVCFPMGCNFGDVDNDGYQDIYLATGDPDFASLWPNLLLRNDRGLRFEDVTTASGTGNLQKGHGVAFGDIDNDGDQDFFVQLGGAYKDDRYWSALYRNPGFGHHWLTARLVGHASNRFGIGTRIRVRIAEPAGERDIYHFVGTSSSFGGNSLQAEIGLGDATRILLLEVIWPTGVTATYNDVPLDRVIILEEGAPKVRLAEPPKSS